MFYLSYFDGESSIIDSNEVSLAPACLGGTILFINPDSSKRWSRSISLMKRDREDYESERRILERKISGMSPLCSSKAFSKTILPRQSTTF